MPPTDPFLRLLDDLGEELLGAQWVLVRSHVEAWAKVNPERLAWLEARVRAYAREQA
jgi:hypothetical protein